MKVSQTEEKTDSINTINVIFLKTNYPLTGPPLFCRICAGLHHHNSPGAEAKQLFKPSKDA